MYIILAYCGAEDFIYSNPCIQYNARSNNANTGLILNIFSSCTWGFSQMFDESYKRMLSRKKLSKFKNIWIYIYNNYLKKRIATNGLNILVIFFRLSLSWAACH